MAPRKRMCLGCERAEKLLAAKAGELNAQAFELAKLRDGADMFEILWATMSDDERREALARIFDVREERKRNGQ